MQLISVLERTPRFVKSLEVLGTYLRAIDFGRIRSWTPGSHASTPWPMVAGAFGAGMVVGAAAALLSAPKTGAELRAQLKTKLAAYSAQPDPSLGSTARA